MLRMKRVTDTLQTRFFSNNNIPRFLLNERAFLKKKSSKCFFLKKINTTVSFLTKISGAVSSRPSRRLPQHTDTEEPAPWATSRSASGTHCCQPAPPWVTAWSRLSAPPVSEEQWVEEETAGADPSGGAAFKTKQDNRKKRKQ